MRFWHRVLVFFGGPKRLPGFGTIALGAYAFIPDTDARLAFWRDRAGPMLAPYLASPWTGLVLVAAGLTWLWFFRGVVHVHHHGATVQLTGAQATAAVGNVAAGAAPDKPTPDVSIQDAVGFALYGHWPGENEDIFGADGDVPRMGEITQRMRGLAHEGELIIWGKASPQSLPKQIDAAFWEDNQIEFMSLWGPPETPKTESVIIDGPPAFRSLMVNKAQMERHWPSK